jgi:hypothetical protein
VKFLGKEGTEAKWNHGGVLLVFVILYSIKMIKSKYGSVTVG